MHRLSDLGAPGAAGSQQARLTERLLSVAECARELLGLSDTEARLLPNLPRGQALWKVGTRSFLVEHRLSPTEAALVDTDARMQAGTAGSLPADTAAEPEYEAVPMGSRASSA
jgi:hypothetical protein